jgi:hypothetical protein
MEVLRFQIKFQHKRHEVRYFMFQSRNLVQHPLQLHNWCLGGEGGDRTETAYRQESTHNHKTVGSKW